MRTKIKKITKGSQTRDAIINNASQNAYVGAAENRPRGTQPVAWSTTKEGVDEAHQDSQQDHDVVWPVGSELFFGFLDGLGGGFSEEILRLVGFLLLHGCNGGDQSRRSGKEGLVGLASAAWLVDRGRKTGGTESAAGCGSAAGHSKGVACGC